MNKTRRRTPNWANTMALAEQAKTMSGFNFLNDILKGELMPAPIAEKGLLSDRGRLYAHCSSTGMLFNLEKT